MTDKTINVLIVNYNTQKLTEACIKSINKHTPNVNVYIFDNSDEGKFINNFSNVTVIDNTDGKIINFNEWLKDFPEREKSPIGSGNDYVSSKHCVSIQKAIDIINDNVILMDSDVLIKRDISELWDEDCIYVGNYEHNRWHDKRLMPFICFINVKMCKEYGIKYFDEKRIVGLTIDGEKYDTGCSFYVDSKSYKHKEVNIYDYIVHFAQGSWNRKNLNVDEWIEKNKALWYESQDNLKIYVCTHKEFEPVVHSSVYEVVNANDINDDTAPNGLKGSFYSEIMTYKYIAENFKLPKYVGFCCYRKYFSFLDNIPDVENILSEFDAIVSKPIIYKDNMRNVYGKYHNVDDINLVEKIIKEKFPEYARACDAFLDKNILIPYNMFIMRREDFMDYIKFIYDILDEYLKEIGTTDIVKHIEDNKDKYLKRFAPNNSVDYQYRIGGYLAERCTNIFMIHRFKKMKTYPVKITEAKYRNEVGIKKRSEYVKSFIRFDDDGLITEIRKPDGKTYIKVYGGSELVYDGSFKGLIDKIKGEEK